MIVTLAVVVAVGWTDVDPAVVFGGLMTGGLGLLGIAIKRTWSTQDAVNEAWAKGRDAGRTEHDIATDKLIAEHAERIRRMEARLDAYRAGLAKIVAMVDPTRMNEVVVVLAEMSGLDEPD